MNKIFKILLLVAAGVIAFSGVSYIKHFGKTRLSIHVIPTDSLISINGQVTDSRKIYVAPGSYSVSAKKSDFSEDKINLKVENKNLDIYLLPRPLSDDAVKWLKDNPKIQLEREAYGAKRDVAIQSTLQSKYPLLNDLPQAFKYFSIDHGSSIRYPADPESIAIYIHGTLPPDRQAALKWISDQGFNPADYEIIFSDFTNPFLAGD